MQAIASSQIFFIITSVAVVLVTVLIVILLAYLISIAHKFWRVSRAYGDEALEIKNIITKIRKGITGIFGNTPSKKHKK